MDNWISVKDKTPQENGYYIVFNGVKVFSSYFMKELDDMAFVDTPKKHPVTHWQPFPNPPYE